MISVENFYHVLQRHLLGPSGLTNFYYYPFGTTYNLSIGELLPWSHTPHHVLFHFDQEPIYDTRLGQLYDDFEPAWYKKFCKLLANSEHSLIKKRICQERGMLDWYYFYHGFAALDWFRDARYLDEITLPSNTFSSYNHIGHAKRSYRLALTARLYQQDLIKHGDVSFHESLEQCLAEVRSQTTELDQHDKSVILEVLASGNFKPPLLLDTDVVDGNWSARMGLNEYRLWQNSFWHLVNETIFYDAKLHLTEKVFKPIVAGRPFILVAAPGNLEYLKQYGFQTFSDFIDESYDLETCHSRRQELIVSEIAKLCALSASAQAEMLHDMQPILAYNKQHFFQGFRTKIVNELVDNFDHCIRIWNNGRVDDRQRPILANQKEIKSLLLR